MIAAGGAVGGSANEENEIQEVWAHNLEEEFKVIRQVVQTFHFVAMDTEFPGVVVAPVNQGLFYADYEYQKVRCNVNLLKIIQLGITFFNDDGERPKATCSTWQFNFKFDLEQDLYAENSIQLLKDSGIQFEKHKNEGIDALNFAELLMSSGVVLTNNIRFVTFHSEYDFGYLLKILTNDNLPKQENQFFELLNLYFPNIYDIKYMIRACNSFRSGSLQGIARELNVERIGQQHQAGSDSLLTGMTFFKIKKMFFEDEIDKFLGFVYRLGTSCLPEMSH